MKISDLLDQMEANSGDDGGQYRNDARRWLNFTRSEIANAALWKMALRPEATFTTAAATTSGLYSLADSSESSSGFEFIAGDKLFDQTNESPIFHESLGTTAEIDAAKGTDGPPTWWSDAGATSVGVRQVYLWPVPDGTYTILFHGYRMLSDIAAADDDKTADDFFGPISPWGACFIAGMRYYHDLNNNEEVNQMLIQERKFQKTIRRRLTQNRLSITATLRQKVVNTQIISTIGRFDPAHYQN